MTLLLLTWLPLAWHCLEWVQFQELIKTKKNREKEESEHYRISVYLHNKYD